MSDLDAMRGDLKTLQQKCHTLSKAHTDESLRQLKTNRGLDITVTVLTVIIGPSSISVFAVDPTNHAMNYLTGILSLLAAVISGTQTVLNPAQSSQDHKTAGDSYVSLTTKIDVWDKEWTKESDVDAAFEKYQELKEDYDDIRKNAPQIGVEV